MRPEPHAALFRALAMWALVLLAGCGRGPGPVKMTTVTFSSDGHALVADLYAPRRPNGIGIVFLHGSSPAGRNLYLYPELCRALGARGYTLFNVDLRGYGDSENPHRLDHPEDFDFVGDARRAAAFVRTWLPRADRWPWIMAGHSMGGGVAVHAALQNDDIQGVVCISPGRRIDARFFASAKGIQYLQRRKSRDMMLPEPIPEAALEGILTRYDVEKLAGATLHKPLLLLEGGREPEADLAFSREWTASLKGPATHRLIAGADHYFGTAKVKVDDGKKKWLTVRPDVFDAMVEMIDDWIQANIRTP